MDCEASVTGMAKVRMRQLHQSKHQDCSYLLILARRNLLTCSITKLFLKLLISPNKIVPCIPNIHIQALPTQPLLIRVNFGYFILLLLTILMQNHQKYLTLQQYKPLYKKSKYNNFLKMMTFQNIQTVNSQQSPCPRWGHSMISIQNQIYVFGGYENSKYYNDLWKFDLNTLAFQKLDQQGDLPPPCSNFTLNYYADKNVLLLFGGGTLNKEKLNAIYQLDMASLFWRKLSFDQSVSLPWQRSYHCAEIIGHYLVISGGEFFHDLDDTWLLNLNTNEWKQIKLPQGAVKPKARKFASSFVHNNKLYIIGGCSGKYDCLEDSYCMNFNEFLQSGDSKMLQWKQVQFEGKELIIRWGHISLSKGNKAYVFGGRHGNKDLQNLIEIDLPTLKCKSIDIKGQIPKGRRKPGICIRNNTLFCFSGFDGSYVKDFIYFSLPTSFDSTKIKQDTEGKEKLIKLLTPDNVEEESLNYEDEVFYVTQDQFEDIQNSLFCSRSTELVEHFKETNYKISFRKLQQKSLFFNNYLLNCYESQQFSLYCPENISRGEKIILFKMFLSYFQFGKVIVQRCEFTNSRKYFKYLLQIAQYYCCQELVEICRKELLKFFTDEVVSQKANMENMLQMCEVMSTINEQYQSYVGYCIINKLLEKHRSSISSLSELIQSIKACKEYKNKEWIFKMADQFSFELSQLIVRKKQVDFQNINSINIPHKQEILYEKTRKGSMHNKHINY